MITFKSVSFAFLFFMNYCSNIYFIRWLTCNKITRIVIRFQCKMTTFFLIWLNWNHPHIPLVSAIVDIDLWYVVWIISWKFLKLVYCTALSMQYNFALLEMSPKLVDQDKSNVKGDTSSAYFQLEQLLVGA